MLCILVGIWLVRVLVLCLIWCARRFVVGIGLDCWLLGVIIGFGFYFDLSIGIVLVGS